MPRKKRSRVTHILETPGDRALCGRLLDPHHKTISLRTARSWNVMQLWNVCSVCQRVAKIGHYHPSFWGKEPKQGKLPLEHPKGNHSKDERWLKITKRRKWGSNPKIKPVLEELEGIGLDISDLRMRRRPGDSNRVAMQVKHIPTGIEHEVHWFKTGEDNLADAFSGLKAKIMKHQATLHTHKRGCAERLKAGLDRGVEPTEWFACKQCEKDDWTPFHKKSMWYVGCEKQLEELRKSAVFSSDLEFKLTNYGGAAVRHLPSGSIAHVANAERMRVDNMRAALLQLLAMIQASKNVQKKEAYVSKTHGVEEAPDGHCLVCKRELDVPGTNLCCNTECMNTYVLQEAEDEIRRLQGRCSELELLLAGEKMKDMPLPSQEMRMSTLSEMQERLLRFIGNVLRDGPLQEIDKLTDDLITWPDNQDKHNLVGVGTLRDERDIWERAARSLHDVRRFIERVLQEEKEILEK